MMGMVKVISSWFGVDMVRERFVFGNVLVGLVLVMDMVM